MCDMVVEVYCIWSEVRAVVSGHGATMDTIARAQCKARPQINRDTEGDNSVARAIFRYVFTSSKVSLRSVGEVHLNEIDHERYLV